jgi:CheY-like chemotaxis protein
MPGKRILVVDDEPGLQKLLRRHAERQGLDVVEAVTSAEALVKARAGKLDLILLDMHLPDGNGLELLAKLQADPRTASIIVVVWSGSDAVDGEVEALRAGAKAYFDKADVKSLMRTLIELLKPD